MRTFLVVMTTMLFAFVMGRLSAVVRFQQGGQVILFAHPMVSGALLENERTRVRPHLRPSPQ